MTLQYILLYSQPALYSALAFLFFGYVVNLPLSFISTLQAIATIFTLSEMLSSHFDLRLDSDSSQRILLSQFYGGVYILENCPKYSNYVVYTYTKSLHQATFGSAKKLCYAKLVLSSHFDLRLDSDSSQRILLSQVFGEVFRLQHKPKIATDWK